MWFTLILLLVVFFWKYFYRNNILNFKQSRNKKQFRLRLKNRRGSYRISRVLCKGHMCWKSQQLVVDKIRKCFKIQYHTQSKALHPESTCPLRHNKTLCSLCLEMLLSRQLTWTLSWALKTFTSSFFVINIKGMEVNVAFKVRTRSTWYPLISSDIYTILVHWCNYPA